MALVVIGDVGEEAIAIRITLEYFGFRVIYYPIGRPNDFINILNSNVLYDDISDIIICSHGEEGAFIMPLLGVNIYEKGEPLGNFNPDVIKRFGKLKRKTVITTGCTLGFETTAKAFLDIGCKYFIGATDDVDGNAALIFVQSFYYKIANGATIESAYTFANKIDEQTSLFKLYDNQKNL